MSVQKEDAWNVMEDVIFYVSLCLQASSEHQQSLGTSWACSNNDSYMPLARVELLVNSYERNAVG